MCTEGTEGTDVYGGILRFFHQPECGRYRKRLFFSAEQPVAVSGLDRMVRRKSRPKLDMAQLGLPCPFPGISDCRPA